MKKEYRTTNQLMKHLRNKHNISIKGAQKQKMVNQGYFHGFKGYRFYKSSSNVINFTDYEEINQTIIFDSKIKTILYSKIMFIETAIKSVVLQIIMDEIKSTSMDDMFEKVIQNFNKTDPFATTRKDKKEAQKRFLSLKSFLNAKIRTCYDNNNNKVVHFSEKNTDLPLWALFDILMLGDFGNLFNALTFEVRDKISKRFNISKSFDTTRKAFGQYIYALKDLRNAIAHNEVVYDSRFLSFKLKKSSRLVLNKFFNIEDFSLDNISDFIFLIVFLLKSLKINKTEQKLFINEIKESFEKYSAKIGDKMFLSDFCKDNILKLTLIFKKI